MEYRIIVINDCGCIMHDDFIKAETENEAMIEFLKDFPLSSGDRITIE